MKTRAGVPITFATLLLALAGCDGAPFAPGPGIDEAVPQFAKLEFERCKPHVNAEEPDPTLELVANAPDQRVDVVLGDDQTEGRFRSNLLVWAGGSACGQASLEYELRYETGGVGIIVIVIAFTDATVRVEGGRTRVAFEGVAEICPERKGDCETVNMTGSVVEEIDDDPIWQFHGPGHHQVSFPAETNFVTPGLDKRASLRGFFPLQEVDVRVARGEGGAHRFEAEFEVGSGGTASGSWQVWDISDPDNQQIRFGFTVREGRFAVGVGGRVLVWLSGTLDVVDGRTVEAASFVATVSQRPIDDDPIWQFHAGGVYDGSFPASGELTVF
jgi:hypothetical protein